MRYLILFLTVFTFSKASFAVECPSGQKKIYKNCAAVSARTKYLYKKSFCEMVADCDSYCGSNKDSRVRGTLYCNHEANNPYKCLPAEECLKDKTDVKTVEDIRQLTNEPRPAPPIRANLPPPLNLPEN